MFEACAIIGLMIWGAAWVSLVVVAHYALKPQPHNAITLKEVSIHNEVS